MRILLVTDSYPPEIRSASHLMYELATELVSRGHDITVVTSWPQYNLDDDARAVTFQEFMDEDGIKVIRVKTLPHHNVNFVVRGIAQFVMPYQFRHKVSKYTDAKFDTAIVYSPPLPLVAVGSWARRKGAVFILNVQDLFPQNAIDLGILKSRLAIGLFRAIERFGYRKAHVVTAHSDGNRAMLRKDHTDIADKFQTLHNWVEIEDHQANEDTIDYRTTWGLDGKLVAVFAGVLGPSQSLDLVLDVAAEVQTDCPDLTFLFVGDGAEKAKLESRVKSNNLTNVEFRPFVSRDEYPWLLKSCDIGLVCLSSLNKTPVVPGKLLGYMAEGLPAVAFLQAESDGHAIIAEAGSGFAAISNDHAGMVDAMRKAYAAREELTEIGARGRTYVSANFSKQQIVDQLEGMISAAKSGAATS